MANPYSAYNQQQNTGEDLRVTEARALLRCAARMEAVQNPAVGYFEYCEAVRQNQKLWTIFQASLIEKTDSFPRELGNLLKSLSLYVDRRSIRAFVEHKAELLDVLISINKQIAAGLMQEADKPAEAAAAASIPAAPVQPVNIAG